MKHYMLLLLAIAAVSEMACAPLAAGLAGAAVGHEVAERQDRKDGDSD
jgi:hypothetical protein